VTDVWGYCPLCGAQMGEFCRGENGDSYVAHQDSGKKWDGKPYGTFADGRWVVHPSRGQLDPLRAAILRVLMKEHA
jgi:hypothetical protein